ncbi:MAG TPA: AAA family ATPase, partial [Thermomicrobiales bacterium]|nr:AAA family ATPase [Thermomicrobiales bacterium]
MNHRAAPPTLPDQPMPRLSRLDLHGFKSFATRTVFVFEPGITAVVGPNGSGKSNISDAVRWVLGETSSNALRSKRTEDVIFAGGKGRAPSGLAEVTVTFNNEEGWLPSEFAEVTVTRRAFRGGDNQYFINGRRVRLKDVALLTASLGQSHTVVGQGLVDAALSQRADERRSLFEHAADLTGLRLKVADAERSLNEADANTARLSDLLNELEPRLKTLERAARQAREWQGLRDRLTFLQRGHFQRLLAATHARLREAEAVTAGDEASLAVQQDALQRLIAARHDAREAAARARGALAKHDARLDAVQEEARRVAHERDLVAERSSALDRRREDMGDTQSGLDEQVARVDAELAQVVDGLRALTAGVDAARSAVEHLEAVARAERRTRSELEREAGELARTITRREREINDLSQRRTLIDQRRESTKVEGERADREAGERASRISNLDAELAAFETADATIAAEIAGLDVRLVELHDAAEARSAEARSASEAVVGLERRLGQATNRFDVLRKVHESGTGLHAGVRQVMQWHRDRSLEGIRGTLAELITVESTYDTAVEVALGGHLQDIVVDRWRDAEGAIARLKRDRAGRATFQPLDSVGRGAGRHGSGRPVAAEIINANGVHGVAADLVRSDEDIARVVGALLGRMVVVDDLPVARRILNDLPAGWSTVTLAGEIARSGGSVTGGSAVRESGVLGRERELRDLPDQIAALDAQVTQARQRQRDIAQAAGLVTEARGRVEAARAGLVAQRRERSGQRDRLAAWLRDLRAQQETTTRRITAAAESGAADVAEIVALEHAEHRADQESAALR